ncbi:SDR family NAD(P)-dependent oxidoreductase [Kitasatospora sp. NBC_00315]|uniref:SDR family NAD(P)-dependent oxidoreductase n=1 Tax=Kitasatospora sp. NBC_00315 TaxID=2975963 RepID=UPI00325273CA
MDFELQDRTVLITGATGGIGAAVARAYAAEGARVAIGYASDAEAAGKLAAELGAAHDRAFAVRCRIGADAAAGEPAGAAAADGSADGSAESAVAAVTERWGGVDALVVCAMEPGGLRPPTAPFESLDPEHWAGFVSANLSHNLRLAQLTLPHMRRSGWGRIVLVSSVVARLGKPGREFYGTVKSGLHGFTRSLMWDLRDTGVLVNLVSPGLTLTPRMAADLPAARRDEEQRATPTGRLSTPEDVATAVLYLGSAANRNITGEELTVAGGR